MTRYALALAAGLSATALCTAPAFAGGGQGPFFDCTGDLPVVLRAICDDPALAAADRRIDTAFRRLHGADGGEEDSLTALAGTLEWDRERFLGNRDAIEPNPYASPAQRWSKLAEVLNRHADVLESLDPALTDALAGSWRSDFGRIDIAPAAQAARFTVHVALAAPFDGDWRCDIAGTAVSDANGVALMTATATPRSKLNLTAEQNVLHISPEGPALCPGMRWDDDGFFFRTLPSPAR